MTASATTYSPKPAYCIPREVPLSAQLRANQLTAMNAPSTNNQDQPESIRATNDCIISAGTTVNRTASSATNAPTAPARCAYVRRINVARADSSAKAAGTPAAVTP